MLQQYMPAFSVQVLIRFKGARARGKNNNPVAQILFFLFLSAADLYPCLKITHKPVHALYFSFSEYPDVLVALDLINDLAETVRGVFSFQGVMNVAKISP